MNCPRKSLKRPTARIIKSLDPKSTAEHHAVGGFEDCSNGQNVQNDHESQSIVLNNLNNDEHALDKKRKIHDDNATTTEDDESIKRLSKIFPTGSNTVFTITNHYNSIRELGKTRRNESRIYYVRQYNNWVKSVMIQQAVSQFEYEKELSVLDLCCGKGGDLLKWDKARPTLYLGLDIAESSIIDANARYRRMKTRMNAYFDVADCFHSPLYIKPDGTGISNPLDQNDEPFQFNIISCMFSFHYAFEGESSVKMALENVSRHLKSNGIFIITIPKASTIEELKIQALANKTKPNVAGNSLFQIEFNLEKEKNLHDMQHNSQQSSGKKHGKSHSADEAHNATNFSTIEYLFSLKEAINKCPEFSVPMEVLFPLAASVGLSCESEMDFLKFYYEYKDNPRYAMLLDRFGLINRTDRDLQLNIEESETVNLYAALAFVKI